MSETTKRDALLLSSYLELSILPHCAYRVG